MKSQVKLGTVFGVELGLHYSWFIIAVLIVFSLMAQFHAQDPNWSGLTIWLVAITTTTLTVTALQGRSLSEKVWVVSLVSAANLFGTKIGQLIGTKYVKDKGFEQRLADLEAIAPNNKNS